MYKHVHYGRATMEKFWNLLLEDITGLSEDIIRYLLRQHRDILRIVELYGQASIIKREYVDVIRIVAQIYIWVVGYKIDNKYFRIFPFKP